MAMMADSSYSDSLRMMAALSADYDAVHVIDLDKDVLRPVKITESMAAAGYGLDSSSYSLTVHDLVERLVSPVSGEMMHDALDADALKIRMAGEKRFSCRYAASPDGTGRHVYETVFFNAGLTVDEHVLVAGTRCIDDVMRLERTEMQYDAALLHDAKFFYEFDVTDGNIRKAFHISEGYDPFFGLDIRLPIPYDLFNEVRTQKLGMVAGTREEASYWTCDGLRAAYAEGKRVLCMRYASENLHLSWNSTVILTEDPIYGHLHAVYVCRDVTDELRHEKEKQRALELALREARRANAAKSEFLSRVSHDIRTPLNGILGVLELNEKHWEDRDMVVSNNKKARVAADHLLSLINDVLDLSKMESGDVEIVKEPLNLAQLITDCCIMCNIQAREKGIRMITDNGRNLPFPIVYGSPLRLRQIFTNILNNAVKYNKPDGMISCSTSVVSSGERQVRYRFEFADSGIGIGEDYLEHIFDPFSQERNDARSRYQGKGLGMAIVKTLLDRMDGTIEVTSSPGVGSCFAVTLPFEICRENRSATSDGHPDLTPLVRGRHILLVEDNELNREIARCLLEDAGMTVTAVSDGVMAYNSYTSSQAGTFDAILMDIMLPNLDGYGATMLIRRSGRDDAQTIPIIAMTANAFESDRKNAIDAGMNAHVAKPIDIDRLIDILSEYFAK